MKKRKPARKPVKKSAKKAAKKVLKKPAKKSVQKVPQKKSPPKSPAKKSAGPSIKEKEIGFVEHYFGHITVAAIKLTKGALSVGDQIHIKGHTSNFFQPVDSMQIDHAAVTKAAKGKDIGIKVKEHARVNDKVYLVKA